MVSECELNRRYSYVLRALLEAQSISATWIGENVRQNDIAVRFLFANAKVTLLPGRIMRMAFTTFYVVRFT